MASHATLMPLSRSLINVDKASLPLAISSQIIRLPSDNQSLPLSQNRESRVPVDASLCPIPCRRSSFLPSHNCYWSKVQSLFDYLPAVDKAVTIAATTEDYNERASTLLN